MNRSHTFYPDEDEASFFFLSDEGDIVYKPVGYDSELGNFSVSVSVDDTRLPRSSTTINTSSIRSQSLPASSSPEDASIPRRPTFQKSNELFDEARLGLPQDWIVFPVSKSGGVLSPCSSGDKDSINFAKFDYTRPIEFSLAAESTDSSETLPSYRSRANSLDVSDITLPAYTIDDELVDVVQAVYEQNKELLKKPKLSRARPLPREFSELEIREIRRKTRHRIRVITRNSLGLTVTLGLSCVAPQMLIAAVINAFCLGRGAYKMHQHMQFMRWNNLRVQKRDVVVAVVEGVAIKLIFLAITVNHDDFLVLTHEIITGNYSEVVGSTLHNLPGFSEANHLFITPIEKVQEFLGLPSMAQRAAGHAAGLAFGSGGWADPAKTVLGNMLLVGTVQTVMESAIDRVQDHLGIVSGRVRDSLHQHQSKEPEKAWSRNRELMFKSGDKYEIRYFQR